MFRSFAFFTCLVLGLLASNSASAQQANPWQAPTGAINLTQVNFGPGTAVIFLPPEPYGRFVIFSPEEATYAHCKTVTLITLVDSATGEMLGRQAKGCDDQLGRMEFHKMDPGRVKALLESGSVKFQRFKTLNGEETLIQDWQTLPPMKVVIASGSQEDLKSVMARGTASLASRSPAKPVQVTSLSDAKIIAAALRDLRAAPTFVTIRQWDLIKPRPKALHIATPGLEYTYGVDVRNSRCTLVRTAISCAYEMKLDVDVTLVGLLPLPKLEPKWFSRKDEFTVRNGDYYSDSLRDLMNALATTIKGPGGSGASSDDSAERRRECNQRALDTLASGDLGMAAAQSFC